MKNVQLETKIGTFIFKCSTNLNKLNKLNTLKSFKFEKDNKFFTLFPNILKTAKFKILD